MDDANDIEGGLVSLEGSTLYRDAAHQDYTAKNCTDTDLSGTGGVTGAAGDDDYALQCDGAAQTALGSDYDIYTSSLATLEGNVDDFLVTKKEYELLEAAAYLT